MGSHRNTLRREQHNNFAPGHAGAPDETKRAPSFDGQSGAGDDEPTVPDTVEWAVHDDIHVRYHGRIAIGCTRCGSCQPCPPGSTRLCLSLCNEACIHGDGAGASPGYHSIAQYGMGAANYTERGACEERCPQVIALREQISNMRALLD